MTYDKSRCEDNNHTEVNDMKVSIKEVALRELKETASAKQQALNQMKAWISNNSDVKNIRLDDNFLLRFLRFKKYSVLQAQQTLLKWLNFRSCFPFICHNLDYEETKVLQLITNGYIKVSPVRDESGRRVIFYDTAKVDPTIYTPWDISKSHLVIYESLLEDEVNQVFGLTHVGDFGGLSAAHIVAWKPRDFARLIKWGEQSMPIRQKAIHIVNVPAALKYIIDLACSMASDKINSRVKLHTNTKSLHISMSAESLPESFGGKLADQRLTSFTLQLLSEQRSILLNHDKMEILNTRGIISTRIRNVNNNIESVHGSFRRLEID